MHGFFWPTIGFIPREVATASCSIACRMCVPDTLRQHLGVGCVKDVWHLWSSQGGESGEFHHRDALTLRGIVVIKVHISPCGTQGCTRGGRRGIPRLSGLQDTGQHPWSPCGSSMYATAVSGHCHQIRRLFSCAQGISLGSFMSGTFPEYAVQIW